MTHNTGGGGAIFVRDLHAERTTLVSDGGALPSLSADGRFVAFQAALNVYVRDLQNSRTTLVSINRTGTGPGNQPSFLMPSPRYASISADGRFVVFMSQSNDLVAHDTNAGCPTLDCQIDVFVRDLRAGTTALLSVNRRGTDSGNVGSQWYDGSADGHVVVFQSRASDLVTGDTNRALDLFVRPTH